LIHMKKRMLALALSLALIATFIVPTSGYADTHSYSNQFPVNTTNYKKIVNGGYGFTVALDTSGNVWTWGFENNEGQQGNGTQYSSKFPVKIISSSNIVDVAAGAEHGLALDINGNVYAWGSNYSAQVEPHQIIGDVVVNRDSILEPINILSNVKQIAAGSTFSVALVEDGSSTHVVTWGRYYEGFLTGINNDEMITSQYSFFPIIDSSTSSVLDDVTSISASKTSAFAIDSDGNLYGWGDNLEYQLGQQVSSPQHSAISISLDLDSSIKIKQVFTSPFSNSIMAQSITGAVYGWGDNSYGRLWLNNQEGEIEPTLIWDDTTVIDIAIGLAFNAAILEEDSEKSIVVAGMISDSFQDTLDSIHHPIGLSSGALFVTILYDDYGTHKLYDFYFDGDNNEVSQWTSPIPMLIDRTYREIIISVSNFDGSSSYDFNGNIDLYTMNMEHIGQFWYSHFNGDGEFTFPFAFDDILVAHNISPPFTNNQQLSFAIAPSGATDFSITLDSTVSMGIQFEDLDMRKGRIEGELRWWDEVDTTRDIFFVDIGNERIGTNPISSCTAEAEFEGLCSAWIESTEIPAGAVALGLFSDYETLDGTIKLFDMYHTVFSNGRHYSTDQSNLELIWDGPGPNSNIDYYVLSKYGEFSEPVQVIKANSPTGRYSLSIQNSEYYDEYRLFAITTSGTQSNFLYEIPIDYENEWPNEPDEPDEPDLYEYIQYLRQYIRDQLVVERIDISTIVTILNLGANFPRFSQDLNGDNIPLDKKDVQLMLKLIEQMSPSLTP